MSASFVGRMTVGAALGGLAAWALRLGPQLDAPSTVVLFLVLGLSTSLAIAKIFLPTVGDSIAAHFYSSGERLEAVASDRTSSNVARGLFRSAIFAYEAHLRANPHDLQAISEVAKLQAEKLGEIDEAVDGLRMRLACHNWKLDEEAFLRFRLVDVLETDSEDLVDAEMELQKIVEDFAGTAHAEAAQGRIAALAHGTTP